MDGINRRRPLRIAWAAGVARADNPDAIHADKDFKRVRGHVLERDMNTCQFCGFIADKWQDVHHLDGNHTNNAEENLVTACRLCHLVFHTGFVGANKMARLIWAPDFTQFELNHLIRTLWIGQRGTSKEIRQASGAALFALDQMVDVLSHVAGFSCPRLLVNQLMNMPAQELQQAYSSQMNGLRLVFDVMHFLPYVQSWAKESYQGLPTTDWEELAVKSIQDIA